jgi:integrase
MLQKRTTRRRRDDRIKIAPGIYHDDVHWYGLVHVRGAGFREKRFPVAAPITDVQAWQATTRAQLLEFANRGAAPGTFTRDAHRYLRDFTEHLASHDTRTIEINWWVKMFGAKPRGSIRPADVARVRSSWLAGGTSPKTINNRCGALRHLYHALDGRRAWTPLDDLDALAVRRTPIRFVPDDLIRKVDLKLQQLEQQGKLRSSKTRARFRVVVSTGRRPSEIMRTEPGDLDLTRRVWLPRDGKGGFSPGIYLNDDMLAAWRFFIEAKAWGPYDTFEHAQRLRLAGWPKDVKPYNARHTVGITLSESGADLDDIGSMLGHKRRETTRKHYVPVLNSRQQKTSERLDGRFQGWPSVQTAVQNEKANRSKMGAKLRRSTATKPAGHRR